MNAFEQDRTSSADRFNSTWKAVDLNGASFGSDSSTTDRRTESDNGHQKCRFSVLVL